MGNPFKIITTVIAIVIVINAHAQTWPSPEVAQMYKQASEQLASGYLQQAIVSYKQLIPLAADQPVLYRDLGKAYYLTQDYTQAFKTLEPLIKSDDADPQSYQIMAASLKASGDKRKAKNTLQKGIERFPRSGLLYHELGLLFEDDNDMPHALEAWLTGIEVKPSYHINYYEAARTYAQSSKPVWTILYAEVFVNMEQHTPRSEETRKLLFDTYRKLYSSAPVGDVPAYGQAQAKDVTLSFEETVMDILMKLAPVVSDGVTAESLTQLRTRFLMDWFSQNNGNRYPYNMFSYQDSMIRYGYYEIYNEWLFGKAENEQQYEAWNKFHVGDMEDLDVWYKEHPFRPLNSDFYNDKKIDRIISGKK